MKCPNCGEVLNYIVNSRPTRRGFSVWRRRKCTECKTIYTTYESIDLSYLIVIKRSRKPVRYNRAKLYSGIYQSAVQGKNVDRGEMGNLAEKLTQEVEIDIMKLNRKKVTTDELRKIVLDVLKKQNLNIYLSYLAYFENLTRGKIREYI